MVSMFDCGSGFKFWLGDLRMLTITLKYSHILILYVPWMYLMYCCNGDGSRVC